MGEGSTKNSKTPLNFLSQQIITNEHEEIKWIIHG